MTYNAKETSDYSGNPVYLYRFSRSGTNYDFCSLAEELDVSSPSGTFAGSSLQHGKIGVGQPVSKDDLDIVFPLSDPFASLLLGRATQFAPTSITIWRGHLDDFAYEFIIVFKGKVRAAKPMDDTKIILGCSGLFSATKLPGLGGAVHPSCRHALYFGGCALDKVDFENVGTVSLIAGNVLTIAEAASQADGFYTSGTLEFGGSQVFILNHVGDQLTVRFILANLFALFLTGTNPVVTLAPGCNHSIDECRAKFDNVLNFGGFPYMPGNDPWNNGSIV